MILYGAEQLLRIYRSFQQVTILKVRSYVKERNFIIDDYF